MGMVSWGDEGLVAPATGILAPNRDEAPVLSAVSAPDRAIVLENPEPPQKDPVVVNIGTPESAMLSNSHLPTRKGKLEKLVQKSSTKQSDE